MPRRKLLRQLRAKGAPIPRDLLMTDIRLRIKAGDRRKAGVPKAFRRLAQNEPIPRYIMEQSYRHFYDPHSPFKFREEE